jgi:carbon-monoxide dehydrogenase medium subunit
MNLPRFEYFEPQTTEEACRLLSEHKDEAKVFAGGTDLLVAMKQREITPKFIINIKSIDSLKYIRKDKEGFLSIGATTTLSDIENSETVKAEFPIVAQAAQTTGPPSIRNVATMAGNFCTALPSADAAPLLICLGARVKIQGTKGVRVINLEDFFVGTKKNALENDEILTEIQAPGLPAHSAGAYVRNSERSGTDIAVVSAAVVITMDETNTNVLDIKIVLGAVAPTPLRALQAEEIIKGKVLSEELIEKAALAASMEAKPRTRPEYKRQLVRVLTSRAIKQAMANL